MLEVNSLCETYQIWLFFRFYENFLELFKSGLLFHDFWMTRKACSRRSWKNYKYIHVIYRVASQFLFLLIVKGIRFATSFHESWNLELCVFWGAKYKYTLVTLNRCDCSRCFLSEIMATVQLWKSYSCSSYKQQQRHFFHDMFYV